MMRKILPFVTFMLLFLVDFSFAERVLLDKVITRVGGSEAVTLLEYQKMKSFLEEEYLLNEKTNLVVSKDEVMRKLITQKILLVLAKKMNMIVPDDDKIVNIISDEKVVDFINSNKLFRKQMISEVKSQFILSRLVNADQEFKDYLQKEPDDRELNKVLEEVYSKNTNQAKIMKASFILITTYLPNDLTLAQEKEIQAVFGEISNYIYLGRYGKALEVANKKLNKYIVTNLTRYQSEPVSLQKLYSEGIPIELLNILGGVRLDQKLPIPINYKVGDKLYTMAVKVISRKEESISFEEFKSNILSVPELKNQIYSKIVEDRIKEWINKSVSKYNISVDFSDDSYRVEL